MTGEVLITGSQSGTAGTGGNNLSNLLDKNSRTWWQTVASNPWAAQDAGVPINLTRVRLDALGAWEDAALGSAIYASNTPFPAGGPLGGASGVSFVQGTFKDQSTVASSISQAFGSNNVAGNCILVGIWTSNPSTYITVPSPPTDTRGNTYVLVRGPVQVISTGSPFTTETAYVYVAMNIAAGANTVSATFSASAPYSEIAIAEYSGVGTASVVDTSGSGTSQGGPTVSASVTTTYAADVLVSYGFSSGGTVTQPSGFTNRITFTFNSWFSDNLAVATPSTYLKTWTSAGTGPADNLFAILVALKAPSVTVTGTNILNLSNRLIPGTLLNEFPVSPGVAYRYYALQCATNNGRIANLDFIGQWASGISAQPVSPTISPPGGAFEYSILVTASTITSGVQLYYTLDGSTPTTASTLYSGAFPVTATSTLKVVAYDAATASYSRVSSARFHVGSGQAIISAEIELPDSNRGYRVWASDPWIFKDPVSGWWYMYGTNLDTPGVYSTGYLDMNVYRSADLKNWQYRGNFIPVSAGQLLGSQTFIQRPAVVYNAANNNYVMWCLGWTPGPTTLNVNVSSSPEGPYTYVVGYSSVNGVSQLGDGTLFKDVDNSAYVIIGNSNTTLTITKLSADYKSITATYQNYSMSSVFGGPIEAPHMFLRNGVYYLLYSGVTGWQANLNGYATSSSPMGTWTVQSSPFQPFAGGVAGTYTDNTISFNTQNLGAISIPGRDDGSGFGAFFYMGDAWNTGLPPATQTSPTASMDTYTLVMLPVSFSGSAMRISWNPNWSFEQVFATVSGAPSAPSGLKVSAGNATWTNNETTPVRIYLDMAPTSQFLNVSSMVVPDGATSVSNVPAANFYRVRSVNASGSSTSAYVAVGSGPLDGLNPPFMPITFPPGPPTATVGVYEDGPGLFVNPSNSTSPVRYNGQTQTSTINIRIPRPV